MLIRTIKYVNLDDETVEETAMFHLSKPELILLDTEFEGGLEGWLERMQTKKDANGILRFFERLVRSSYGVKSEDGRYFEKKDTITDKFMQSPAYDELFMQILSSEEEASRFFLGIIPKQLREEVNAAKERRDNVSRR